jgi:hypothetical protein
MLGSPANREHAQEKNEVALSHFPSPQTAENFEAKDSKTLAEDLPQASKGIYPYNDT